MLRSFALILALSLPAHAQQVTDMAPRDGWEVMRTQKSFDGLVASVRSGAKAGGLAVVTQAGPTGAAARRGITLPGNRVIGLYNNDFAVRLLQMSTAAMIEAPIRMYVTENSDGTATLSYERPSVRLAPYMDEAPGLEEIAAELDAAFESVAEAAIR